MASYLSRRPAINRTPPAVPSRSFATKLLEYSIVMGEFTVCSTRGFPGLPCNRGGIFHVNESWRPRHPNPALAGRPMGSASPPTTAGGAAHFLTQPNVPCHTNISNPASDGHPVGSAFNTQFPTMAGGAGNFLWRTNQPNPISASHLMGSAPPPTTAGRAAYYLPLAPPLAHSHSNNAGGAEN